MPADLKVPAAEAAVPLAACSYVQNGAFLITDAIVVIARPYTQEQEAPPAEDF